jgi:uncharacterized FlaG/YvyC family protein
MSDAVPVTLPASLVPANQTSIPAAVPATSGNNVPQSGKSASALPDANTSSALRANAQTQNVNSVAPKATATNKASVADLVKQLNKFLNDSGRADQFRIDPESRNQIIQEINPANGVVVGEFSVSEFPALARSLGVSGILVDSHA